MRKPWSKLQKELYELRADGLDFQIHCSVYRMDSRRGTTDLPRYWITLNKEIIWDYPKDFVGKNHPDRTPSTHYPYSTDVPDISNLIREYIDTPKDDLFDKVFENDHWGLANILKAFDRRIGVRRLPILKKKIKNRAAHKILDSRM